MLNFYNARRMSWFRPTTFGDYTTDEIVIGVVGGQPDIAVLEWRDHGTRAVPRLTSFCDGWAHLPDNLIAILRHLGTESGAMCPTTADVEAALVLIGAVDVSDTPAVRS